MFLVCELIFCSITINYLFVSLLLDVQLGYYLWPDRNLLSYPYQWLSLNQNGENVTKILDHFTMPKGGVEALHELKDMLQSVKNSQ